MSVVKALVAASVVGAGWAGHSAWLVSRLRSARLDPVTGLLGRRVFEVRAARVLRRRPCLVVFADVDRFKSVNDVYGHAAGDVVLAETARVLRAWAGVLAVVARLGGDEFAIVVPDPGPGAGVLLAELRQRLMGPVRVRPLLPLEVEISLGAVRAPVGTPLPVALRAADAAMYAAKAGVETGDGTGPGWVLAPSLTAPETPRRHKRRGLTNGYCASA